MRPVHARITSMSSLSTSNDRYTVYLALYCFVQHSSSAEVVPNLSSLHHILQSPAPLLIS